MSPEQLSGENYDKSIDWWAIGIMLYELLYGSNPYSNKSDDKENLSNMEFKEIVLHEHLVFPNAEKTAANDLIT